MKKLTEDQKLQRWGKRILKIADKALAEGRINRVRYRDITRIALGAMRSREHAKVIGW